MLPERILSRIDRSEPCWRWLASHTNVGRPQVMLEGKMWLVYRLLYTAEVGPIPDGMTLDHVVCQNGWCCNPAHLEPVTNSENIKRALAIRYEGRIACPSGHPYALYRRYRKTGKYAGKAYCVQCGTLRAAEWSRANKPWRKGSQGIR